VSVKRAFTRLQQQIIATSADHSIFVWGLLTEDIGEIFVNTLQIPSKTSVLAGSPKAFETCSNALQVQPGLAGQGHYTMTNKGLDIRLPIVQKALGSELAFAMIACAIKGREDYFVGVAVQKTTN
jgi:hypothetical protein